MKKKYAKDESIIILCWLFLIIFTASFCFMFQQKIYSYNRFSGVFYTDTILQSVISDEDMKNLQKNKKIYLDNKEQKVEFVRIDKNITEKNNISYNQIFISLSKSKYKTGDVVDFTTIKRRINVMNIFKIIWEGDNN